MTIEHTKTEWGQVVGGIAKSICVDGSHSSKQQISGVWIHWGKVGVQKSASPSIQPHLQENPCSHSQGQNP